MTTEYNRVFWLASYPKSGNTWIRLFLQAYMDGKLNINKLNVCVNDINYIEYQAVCAKPVTEMRPEILTYYRQAALINTVIKLEREKFIFKTHNANVLINGNELIPKSFTDTVVYIVRDPRDVVISLAHHLNVSIDEAIDFLNNPEFAITKNSITHFVRSWEVNVNSWIDEDYVCVIKYEDLLVNPLKNFKEILKTLRIIYDEAKIKRAIKLCNFSELQKQEDKNGFTEATNGKFFRAGKSSWEGKLTEDQIYRIESVNKEAMERLGYGLHSIKKRA